MMHRQIAATHLVTMSKVNLQKAWINHNYLRLGDFLNVGLESQGHQSQDKLKTTIEATLVASENGIGLLDVPLEVKVHYITNDNEDAEDISWRGAVSAGEWGAGRCPTDVEGVVLRLDPGL